MDLWSFAKSTHPTFPGDDLARIGDARAGLGGVKLGA